MSENPSPLSPSPKKREEWRVGGREERSGERIELIHKVQS
jgi:hypothetical protein